MSKNVLRFLCLLVAACMMVLAAAGCAGGTEKKADQSATQASTPAGSEKSNEQDQQLLEYSYYSNVDPPAFADPKDDVVTPIVEKKFNIRVKNVYYSTQGLTFKERLNLFIASNELPDVIQTFSDFVTLPSTGRFAELGDMLKQNCPNLLKMYPEDQWKDALYNGKMYVFPGLYFDLGAPEFKDDLYAIPAGNFTGFWTRESILNKLGYKFTPLVELNKKVTDTQTKPTEEDFKIEPAIATPDDLYNFLKKIKETIPKVNEKDIIPFSMPIWLEPHLGAMFGLTGNWKYNPNTKKVSQFLGDEHAKEYWQFMNKLYSEGLLDKDFAIQKDEQLQENAVQGRIACFLWCPNSDDVQKAVQQADPSDSLRFVPLPMQPGTDFVGIDPASKASYEYYISKDVKDISRLLKYFDWFQTKEAMDLYTWGPESLGLWEIKDGKKMWKEDVYNHIIGTSQEDQDWVKKNYFMKGLGQNGLWASSKAFGCVPMMQGYNPAGWNRSYPLIINPNNYGYSGAILSAKGNDFNGRIAPGVDDLTNLAVAFSYGEFEQQYSAKLFAARTDEEFNKNWDDIQKYFQEKMQYAAAKKRMELDFKTKGFDVLTD